MRRNIPADPARRSRRTARELGPHPRSEKAGHHDVADLVRRVRVGFGGRGCQLAIARTHRRAASLSAIPGRCRRSSTAAASWPLSANTRRMISAVAASTLNMAPRWAGAPRPARQTAEWLASNRAAPEMQPNRQDACHASDIAAVDEAARVLAKRARRPRLRSPRGRPLTADLPFGATLRCLAAVPLAGIRTWLDRRARIPLCICLMRNRSGPAAAAPRRIATQVVADRRRRAIQPLGGKRKGGASAAKFREETSKKAAASAAAPHIAPHNEHCKGRAAGQHHRLCRMPGL